MRSRSTVGGSRVRTQSVGLMARRDRRTAPLLGAAAAALATLLARETARSWVAAPQRAARLLQRRVPCSGAARGARASVARRVEPWEDGYELPPPKEYVDDFDDACMGYLYQDTMAGSGGQPPPGRLKSLITAYFSFDVNDRPEPGGPVSDYHHNKAFETMKEQMKLQTWLTWGGPKKDTADDGKGWVWVAAEMTVVGLCLQIYKSVPYGRRPLLIAKADDVEPMFESVDWAKVEKRLDVELGTEILKDGEEVPQEVN